VGYLYWLLEVGPLFYTSCVTSVLGLTGEGGGPRFVANEGMISKTIKEGKTWGHWRNAGLEEGMVPDKAQYSQSRKG